MDSIPFPIRIVIALPFWLIPGLMLSYFRKPEDFVLKRLRPKENIQFSHSQLIYRSFVGAGLCSILLVLGVGIITSKEGFLEWRGLYVTITLVMWMFMGTFSYLNFRLWRYVEIAPPEQGTLVSRRQRVFVRRITPDSRTWGLRLALIILAAVAVVVGPTILIILTILTENFLS